MNMHTLMVDIIPGNLNSNQPMEKFIFHLKLPLEAEEREGQLHRDIQPHDEWWVTEPGDLTRPTCLEMNR